MGPVGKPGRGRRRDAHDLDNHRERRPRPDPRPEAGDRSADYDEALCTPGDRGGEGNFEHLERYVFGDSAGRDANGMRTEAAAAEASEIGGA